MQPKEWITPTFTVLTWEQVLESEGLGNPEKDLNFVSIRDTDGVRIPAQPVREGGLFWRERAQIHWGRQERKKVDIGASPCMACGTVFRARRGSRFCSRKCQMRMLMRAKRVSAKLPTLSEETAQ